MSFENSIEAEKELSTLTERENDLSLSVLEHTSLAFLGAWKQHRAGRPYVRQFMVVTPVPTLAFKLVSKDTFSVETGKPGVNRLTKEIHHVFVPKEWADSNPTEPSDRIWFRRFEPGSKARMYVVERAFGRGDVASIRRHAMDAEMREEMEKLVSESTDETPVQLEFSTEDLLISMIMAVDEKKSNIEELEHLRNAMIGTSRIVAFDE